MEHEAFYYEGIAALTSARENQLPQIDNEALHMNDESKQNLKRKQRSDEISDWSYISVSKILNEDDDYVSSCDELEETEYQSNEDINIFSSDSEESQTHTVAQITKSKADSECFLCNWVSNNGVSYSLNKINVLVTMLETNYGKMNNIALAKAGHQYFKNEIWPDIPRKFKIPMWRTKTALRHIECHSLEPRVHIGENIKRFKRLSDVLENMSFRKIQNQNGEVIIAPDVKVLKTITDIEKTVRELYKSAPNTMNFYRENCKIDFTAISSHVNLNKNFNVETE